MAGVGGGIGLGVGGSNSLVLGGGQWWYWKGDVIGVRAMTTLSVGAAVSGGMGEGVSLVGEGVCGGAPCIRVVEKWPH